MRLGLTDSLRCLECHGSTFRLDSHHDASGIVHSGAVECLLCGTRYPVKNGILGMLSASLGEDTAKELEARQQDLLQPDIEAKKPYLSDPRHPGHWEATAANFESALQHLDLQGRTVLDLGAGTCWSTRLVAERGAWAVACDISLNYLDVARVHLESGHYFDRVLADMNDLPFADNRFDVVLSQAVVHHADDLEHVFDEAYRVLVDGGHFVMINEPTLGILRNRDEIMSLDKGVQRGINEHLYAFGEYQRAIRQSGFRDTKLLFPESVIQQLRGTIHHPPTWRYRLFRLFPPLFWRPFLLPGHILIGLPLLMFARK